jgi:transcriptional regulator with XRE-family HTH domain
MTSMSFGKRLEQLREQSGLTAYALGKLTGITRQAIGKLEAGGRVPTWDTVQLLAKALGVDCTAFADSGLELPAPTPPGKPGRPRKAEADVEPAPASEPAPAARGKRKGKGG